jgi:hypothetical protein
VKRAQRRLSVQARDSAETAREIDFFAMMKGN